VALAALHTERITLAQQDSLGVPPSPAPAVEETVRTVMAPRPAPAIVTPFVGSSTQGSPARPALAPKPARRPTLSPYTKAGLPAPTPRKSESPGPGSALNGNSVTPLGQVPIRGGVSKTHFQKSPDSEFLQPVTPTPEAQRPSLFPGHQPPASSLVYPTERMTPPSILGSHLGLHPGETATERSFRLMTALGELQTQVEGLEQRNAELEQQVQRKDDQLLLAIREIKSVRREVSSAKEELERLRSQISALQEKVQNADRDNAALLQTMAPLLQKLLESEVGPPPDPEE